LNQFSADNPKENSSMISMRCIRVPALPAGGREIHQ
jgi:hypothetical protein